jgi:hypothetical protein
VSTTGAITAGRGRLTFFCPRENLDGLARPILLHEIERAAS